MSPECRTKYVACAPLALNAQATNYNMQLNLRLPGSRPCQKQLQNSETLFFSLLPAESNRQLQGHVGSLSKCFNPAVCSCSRGSFRTYRHLGEDTATSLKSRHYFISTWSLWVQVCCAWGPESPRKPSCNPKGPCEPEPSNREDMSPLKNPK